MKSPEWIQLAMTEFAKGKTLFFVREPNRTPEAMRKKLYNAAQLRGYYNWRFAIDGDTVIIRYMKTN